MVHLNFMKSILLTTLFLYSFVCSAQELVLEPIAGLQFDQPVEISSTEIDGDDRLFVVEKKGVIYLVENISSDNPEKLSEPFLDLSSKVNSASEGGLLGLAFSPEYATKGYFFVHYTFNDLNNGNKFSSRISRFNVSDDDPSKADLSSEVPVLTVVQNEQNHNGGDIVFGPDNMLYVAFGDGGGAGDIYMNGQNPQSFLGKILRIDVKSLPYNIPIGNPYKNDDNVFDEIWSVGLRNPWRISFDRETGDLWISDVGQDQFEEINLEKAGSPGAINYGWNCYEGEIIFDPIACVYPIVNTEPVYSYSHNSGPRSVTGGYVYRGSRHPDLYGKYVFTDFVSSKLWWIISGITNETYDTQQIVIESDDVPSKVTTFGEGNDGELYFATFDDGRLWRLMTTIVAGIENDRDLSRLRIYPNPFQNHLNLEMEIAEEVYFQIRDSYGRLVKPSQLMKSNNIDLQGHPAGVYFMTVRSKRSSKVFRLLKVD